MNKININKNKNLFFSTFMVPLSLFQTMVITCKKKKNIYIYKVFIVDFIFRLRNNEFLPVWKPLIYHDINMLERASASFSGNLKK